jgi:tetratricopeptide (TPR) repeat protein
MEQPELIGEVVATYRDRGFRAFKIGWGPFGRRNDAGLDEAIVAAARDAAGTSAQLMVDAGGSDAYWTQGYKWALRTSQMLAAYGVDWFEEALSPDALEDFILLRRASKKQIAMRMLQNLRGVYLRRRDWARAVDTLDLLLVGAPELSGLLKQRGLLHMELKRFQAARGDLERYLAMEPEAADRDEIRKQIRAIHAWLARVN